MSDLSPDIEKALQAELTRERQNAAVYGAMGASLSAVNWPGSAAFMRKSAGEEMEHARKFEDYLIDRGAFPEYGPLQECACLDSVDLVEYFAVALEVEQATTKAILAICKLADEKDEMTEQFLLWFIEEQRRSERDLVDTLQELERYDGSAVGYKLFDRSLID